LSLRDFAAATSSSSVFTGSADELVTSATLPLVARAIVVKSLIGSYWRLA
jgi:hypothetical protein